jgi:hypothetical protein
MRASVDADAKLLPVDLWMDPPHTQPLAAPLMSGEFLVIFGEGQAYGEDQAGEWLGQTGWRKLERRPLVGPASVIMLKRFDLVSLNRFKHNNQGVPNE